MENLVERLIGKIFTGFIRGEIRIIIRIWNMKKKNYIQKIEIKKLETFLFPIPEYINKWKRFVWFMS